MSNSETVFRVGRVRHNTRKGSAKLWLQVPESGTVNLSGKGLAKRTAVDAPLAVKRVSRHVGAGKVKVPIKAKGKAKRRLDRHGRARVKVRIAYDPAGGAPATQTIVVTLRKKLGG